MRPSYTLSYEIKLLCHPFLPYCIYFYDPFIMSIRLLRVCLNSHMALVGKIESHAHLFPIDIKQAHLTALFKNGELNDSNKNRDLKRRSKIQYHFEYACRVKAVAC